MGNKHTQYDIVFKIPDLESVTTTGWKIDVKQEILENNKKQMLTWQGTSIGVLGRFKQGKTFLLSKLAKLQLASEGEMTHTEGISLKFMPDEKNSNHRVIMDAAGLFMPIQRTYTIFLYKTRIKLLLMTTM